jgi:hypothetical protein
MGFFEKHRWVVVGWMLLIIAVFLAVIIDAGTEMLKFPLGEQIQYVVVILGSLSVIIPSISAWISTQKNTRSVTEAFVEAALTLLFVGIINIPITYVAMIIIGF